ncbi:MAG TPA: HEAT repeat domain-containing protein, partial [Vicinamibacterales bacterium]|nr:HEAT repeat domain-containing protein [Vicinamibacterales bacterium]
MTSCGALTLILLTGACASVPPPVPVTPAAGPRFEQKMAWILRLEDQRLLRDTAPILAPPAPIAARGQTPVVVPPLPPPDLLRMLADEEARVRRRAALAIGRVGLADGVQPLVGVLGDSDPEVRQMAAFALGL